MNPIRKTAATLTTAALLAVGALATTAPAPAEAAAGFKYKGTYSSWGACHARKEQIKRASPKRVSDRYCEFRQGGTASSRGTSYYNLFVYYKW